MHIGFSGLSGFFVFRVLWDFLLFGLFILWDFLGLFSFFGLTFCFFLVFLFWVCLFFWVFGFFGFSAYWISRVSCFSKHLNSSFKECNFPKNSIFKNSFFNSVLIATLYPKIAVIGTTIDPNPALLSFIDVLVDPILVKEPIVYKTSKCFRNWFYFILIFFSFLLHKLLKLD